MVINQTVKGDLNFRVFEAMMCGALVLTEYAGNGLLELFEDGRHLICYEKNNVADAAAKIRECLGNLPRTRAIAAAGREEVLRAHCPTHRAARILELAAGLTKKRSAQKFFANAYNCSISSRTVEKIDSTASANCLLGAMKSLERGLHSSEQMSEILALEAVYACLRYEQVFGSPAGGQLLADLAHGCADSSVLALAQIRALLNRGRIAEARELSAQRFTDAPEKMFTEAEQLVQSVLSNSPVFNQ